MSGSIEPEASRGGLRREVLVLTPLSPPLVPLSPIAQNHSPDISQCPRFPHSDLQAGISSLLWSIECPRSFIQELLGGSQAQKRITLLILWPETEVWMSTDENGKYGKFVLKFSEGNNDLNTSFLSLSTNTVAAS